LRDKKTTILVDFGPDIKSQLIDNNIDNVDYIICTHAHNDHISGIDELRVFGFNKGFPVPIYSDSQTLKELKIRNSYLFNMQDGVGPFFELCTIDKFGKIELGDFKIEFFNQIHGFNSSLGIRVGGFVYSNDVTDFPIESTSYLKNVKHWVLDCIDYKKTHAHAGLEEVLKWSEKFLPEKVYLTNLSHHLDYNKFKEDLPENIVPCYDGLKIIIK
jgi:phosphoribosyl 1,2-cyclic phosphate phosphodiesterase